MQDPCKAVKKIILFFLYNVLNHGTLRKVFIVKEDKYVFLNDKTIRLSFFKKLLNNKLNCFIQKIYVEL